MNRAGPAVTLLHHAVPPDLLPALIDQTAWRHETIQLFGRRHLQPRLIAWHGDPDASYRYSGLSLAPLPWTTLLAALRDQVQHLAATPFNAVLLNYYRDENDSMGLHSDDEPELGPDPTIASISLGAERCLLFRHKTDRAQPPLRLALPDRSLLIMHPPTQRDWKHGIEKRRQPCAPRVNLTFRHVAPWRSAQSGFMPR